MPNAEQIEVSVVAMDSQMIVLQPEDLNNQPANDINDVQLVVEVPQVSVQPIDVHDLTADADNNQVQVTTPNTKKRKR